MLSKAEALALLMEINAAAKKLLHLWKESTKELENQEPEKKAA